MSGATPAESLAKTLPMLYRITVLADQDRLADAAEAIAPSEGRSVLIDREALGELASLAQSHKRLLYTEATTFDNLPFVDGKPDFANQSSHRTAGVALSPDGVRAVAAVLASAACVCEMLVNEHSGSSYWIWALPTDAAKSPTKYVVDATTLHISRS
jgi:hypothetical protein